MSRVQKIASLVLSLSLLLSLLSACAEGTEQAPALREGAMRLSEQGVSDWRVVVSAEASDDTKTMAEEFVTYFEEITGARLPVVTDAEPAQKQEIVIGRTTRAIDAEADYGTLGEEGFLNLTRTHDVLLTGNTDRAVAYAVYAFLEQSLGVRYLAADYEYLPETPTLDIAQDTSRKESPGFIFRTLEGAGATDPVWAVKMRLNSRQSLGSENYRRELFVGGGWGYADWFVHTITKLAELPEKDENGNYNTAQPCLTDETVYQTVLKNVRRWLDTYPDADIVSISQNDGGDESSMCTCENCKAVYNAHGNVQSALWVNFVSRIADELADEYPDVYFDTLAYSFTMLAPTGLEIPDNVIIRLAPIGICYEHATLSCANDRSSLRAQRTTAKLKFALEGWRELTDNLFIWDYSALFANYWAPLANFDTMRQNIANYYENGVIGFYMQGAASSPLSELSAYLTAKLLWDPDMSDNQYNRCVEEFVRLYYGVESTALTDYFDLVDTAAQESHYSTHGLAEKDFLPLSVKSGEEGITLDTTLIDRMKDCFDRARAEEKSEEQALHLRKAEISVKYYELICLFNLEEKEADATVDLAARRALGEELYEDVTACGIREISERKNTIPQEPNFDLPPLQWDNSQSQTVEQY